MWPSRAEAKDAQLYTNDRAKLPEALGHDVSHESAHMPTIKPEQFIKPPQPEITPVITGIHLAASKFSAGHRMARNTGFRAARGRI